MDGESPYSSDGTVTSHRKLPAEQGSQVVRICIFTLAMHGSVESKWQFQMTARKNGDGEEVESLCGQTLVKTHRQPNVQK